MAAEFFKEIGAWFDLKFTPRLNDALNTPEDTKVPTVIKTTLSRKVCFALWGQSNMVGYNDGPTISPDDDPDPRIKARHRGEASLTFYAWGPDGSVGLAANPLQHDPTSMREDSVGLGIAFAKKMRELYPWIEEILLVPSAESATAFRNNDWNPGDTVYQRALTEVNTFMQSGEYVFGGILVMLGETDAEGTAQEAADFGPAAAAMVAHARANIINGGGNFPILWGSMLSTWIGSDAERLEVDKWHNNIRYYIPNSYFIDLDDLTTSYDTIHFGAADLRTAGQRFATNYENLNWTQNPEKLPDSMWLKVLNGEITDLQGGIFHNENCTVQNDATRGDVIRMTDTGTPSYLVCSKKLSKTAYTKALWINRVSNIGEFENMISGSGRSPISHAFGIGGYGHSNTYGSNPNLETDCPVGTWVHVALTWDGTNFNYYLDGVLTNGPTTAGAGTFSDQGIYIGQFQTSNQGINALIDDVQVFDVALSATQIADLYTVTTI